MTVDGRLFSQTEALSQPQRGPAAVLDTLRDCIATLAAPLNDLKAIGIASAGYIDPESGVVLFAGNLGWRNVPLGPPLAAHFGVPVTVENDVRAAAWGEFRFGVHRSPHSLLAVFVGTGIGSGLVADGRLWRGASHGAGELGHTRVVADGLPCPCGGRGCLEQYASGRGFQRRLRDALTAGVKTTLGELTEGEPDALDATMVAAAANSGDDLARSMWSDATRYLTAAVANYVTLANPEVLILGGGLFESLPELFEAVSGGVLVGTTAIAREALSIEHARLGDWAGVLGSAALAS